MDTAGLGKGRHPFGGLGANLANLTMQLMGWGGILAGILLVMSGIRRLMGRVKPRRRRSSFKRFMIAFGIILMGMMTLSAFPIPQNWPMGSGLGGWVGDILHLTPKSWLDGWGWPFQACSLH